MERSMSPRYTATVVGEIGRPLWRPSNHRSISSATVVGPAPARASGPDEQLGLDLLGALDGGPALAGHWATDPAVTAGQRVAAGVDLEPETVAIGALSGHWVTPGPAVLPAKE
jgi:hypothetical protein